MDRLSAMETFVYVVETGSFSAAARRLRIGQPAVSKIIAHLEERLSVRLLLRSTRGLMPTEAGLVYFEHAKRAIQEANEADHAARGAGTGLTGTLRICAAVTFSRLHLLPHLGAFLDMHPGLSVDVVLDDQNVNLVEEGIDVALRMGAMSDSSLTARKIGEGRRLVLGTPGYFQRFGIPHSPADLPAHQAIIYSQRGGGAHWLFRQGNAEQAVILCGRVRMSAAEGVRTTVLADLGLTISSEWMFAPELISGEIIPVLKDWHLPSVDLWAVFPTGRMMSAKAKAFVSYVEHLMNAGQPPRVEE